MSLLLDTDAILAHASDATSYSSVSAPSPPPSLLPVTGTCFGSARTYSADSFFCFHVLSGLFEMMQMLHVLGLML